MQRLLKSVIFGMLLSLLLSGCGAHQPIPLSAVEEYHLYKNAYDQKKYREAVEGFERFVRIHSGSEFAEAAQFYLAEAHYYQRDYILASTEYRYYLNRYATSPHAEEALFKLAMCYYHQSPKSQLDQTATEVAIRELSRFITKYPNSPYAEEAEQHRKECRNKLAKKTYDNGYIYARSLKAYDAAILYYQQVLDLYSDTDWVDNAQWGIAEAYRKSERWEDARQAYTELVQMEGVEPKLKERAQAYILEMEQHIPDHTVTGINSNATTY